MIWALIALGFSIIGFLGWYGHRLSKAGEDAARADTAEDVIDKATKANQPVTDAERARVVQLFQRRP